MEYSFGALVLTCNLNLTKVLMVFVFCCLDDNIGPVLCEELGLNLQSLPQYLRIQTRKTHSYTCNVIGSLIPDYIWHKDSVSKLGSHVLVESQYVKVKLNVKVILYLY